MLPRLACMTVGIGILLVDCSRSPRAADSGVLAGPGPISPPSAKQDTTNQLVDLLKLHFSPKPGFDDQYWIRNDYGQFWTRLVDLLDQGADTNAAFSRGANVWDAAFVADARCRCTQPRGWEGLVGAKCTNPRYFPGCLERNRADREKRVEILLAHGVNPNQDLALGSGHNAAAPLCIAVNTGLTNSVVPLISHKASCTKPCWSSTLLHAVASYRTPDLLCALIRCGAPVDGRDNKGTTPLFEAAESGLPRNVAILLDYGADQNATNNDGHDAISVARRKRKSAVIHLLKQWTARKPSQATHSACGPRGG